MWKIKLSIFASTVLLILPWHLQAQVDYGWSIDSFDALIDVNEDASLTITETISTTFGVDKHGILRNIPVVYRDQLGNKVRIKLDVLSVLRNGEIEDHFISYSGSNKVLRIGNPFVTITGEQVYEIRYRVERAILYFDQHDELYWNVTGTPEDTEVPITNATAVVRLPEGISATATGCYTGYFGSTEQDCGIAVDGSTIGFAAEDFLTVAVAFPKGAVYEPTFFDRFVWFLKANKFAVVPFFIILAVVIFWWYLGRDPRMHKVVIAEYDPPEDLWPAYAGFMTKETFTKWHIASMIVQMAVAGYLKFSVEELKKGRLGKRQLKTTLVKLKESQGLDEAHKELFDTIFKKRKEVTLEQLRGKIPLSTMRSIRKSIRKKLDDAGYYTKSGFKLRQALFAVAGAMLYVAVFFGAFTGAVTGLGLFVATLVTFIFAWFMPKKTIKGVKMLRRILGFKLFMHTAERYRSEWQERKGIFAEFLPYAIAFHDVDRWAKAFEGIEQKNPSWYDSRIPFVSTAAFAADLTSMSQSLSTATSPRSAPSSSGVSGGGFSGGGYGGGGTGSW
ncbi:DUF2207 domain-containing protein [Patescibacteria group bacterium]|nr:DUF2207 domain-containing protein [Patescibacteria group bacterium]